MQLSLTKCGGTKMNVLIVGMNEYFLKDLEEYFTINDDVPYYADNSRGAIQILSETKIDLVILEFCIFDEVKLVKYINDNYPETQVVLTTSKKINEMMKIIKNSEFRVLQHPFRFSELKKLCRR